MIHARSVPMLAAVGALLVIGCGPEPAVERGRALFESTRLSKSPSNVFSCATCHPSAPGAGRQVPVDGRRYPASSLAGAVTRTPLWCGGFTSLLDAVNECLEVFMRGDPLAPEDVNGRALLVYLRSLAPDPDGPRTCTLVRVIDDAYLASLPPGQAERGAAMYRAACQACHGAPRTGDGRLGPRVSILPDVTLGAFGEMARLVTAEKVRHGKFFGIGGLMPFYTLEALSDAELSDLLSFLFDGLER